jgi:hypothetical protein
MVASLMGLVVLLLLRGTIGSTLAAVKYNHLAESERRAKIAESQALQSVQKSAREATEKADELERQLYSTSI